MFITILLFIWLKSGIKIDHFQVGQLEVKQLYISLDKKFSITANKLMIPKTKSTPHMGDIKKVFHRVRVLLTFFDFIAIDEIMFKNLKYKIIYVNGTLHIESDLYTISGILQKENKKIEASILEFQLKNEPITLAGELSYDYKNRYLEMHGTYNAFGIEGKYKAFKKRDTIEVDLLSETFTNLKPIIKRFHLEPVIEEWILERVPAQNYKLNHLKVYMKLNKENEIEFDFNKLYGEIVFHNAQIVFHKKLPPIDVEHIVLHYQEGGLYFTLHKPTYLKREMCGSYVNIVDLSEENVTLHLDLKMKTPLDNEVQKILHAYGLKIPLQFANKHSTVTMKMAIPLCVTCDYEMKTDVEVVLQKGELKYGSIVVPLQKGRGTYRDDEGVKLDLTFAKGNVTVQEVLLPIKGGSLEHSSMQGVLYVDGGEIRDLKGYNNLVALINTLPALTTFSSPGFSEKGFKFSKGKVDYSLKESGVFDVTALSLKGDSSTVVGQGELDTNCKLLDFTLAIQVARNLGKVVGNIPLLGYILLGEDNSMTLGVNVYGTIDAPKVEPTTGQEVLMLPFNLLKRTLKSPIQMFSEQNTTMPLEEIEDIRAFKQEVNSTLSDSFE
jgi:uncharacterized protein YueI